MNISARRSGAKYIGLFFQLPGSLLLCALLASLQLFLSSLAAALPIDGHVVAGQATIQKVSPTTLSIAQASDKAILNWNSFSIASNEAVHFIQPSVSSIALNRVVGVDPSVILGQLQANGRIFLINPNGILFGAGAQINVGGLLATTLQTRDDDFMAGRYLFAQDPLKGLNTVVNRGTIHVSDNGYLVLMAPGVSNEGVIVANLGTALLGSGQKFTLDLMGDGLIRYAINDKVLGQVTGPDGKPLSSAVSNSGSIQADGGQVILSARASDDVFSSVVNQSGVIRAHNLINRDGIVRLEGGDTGLVQMAGTIDASGLLSNQKGGQVSILGQHVALLDQAKVDVSGDAGGGTVLVGGNYQGKGPESNAERTLVQSGVSITADARTSSDGGKVIVWADGDTRYAGVISAQGGATNGNGGFVEVSGKNALDFRGAVDVAAPKGVGGRVLLDPQDILLNTTIQPSPPNNPNGTPDVAFADPPAVGTYTVQIADVTGFSELFLQATRDITAANPVTMGAGNSIRLEANNNISINAGANVTVSGVGSIQLRADADSTGAGAVALNAPLVAQQGGIQISGAGVTSVAAGTITTTGAVNQNAGNVTINSTGSVNLSGAITANGGTAGAGTPGRAGGTISITGTTGVTTGALTTSGSNGNGANQAGGNAGTISVTNTTSGNLTTGALTARTGNAVGTGAGGAAGSISVTQSNAAVGAFLQTSAINMVGGSNGAGGSVDLSSQSGLQFGAAATIQTTGGAALANTAGRNGGGVTLSGRTVTTTGAITASGSNGNGANQAGGNAGTISITSNGALTTSAGALTTNGGNAGGGNAGGGNGGTITVTNNSATTGNVTTGAITARTGNAVGTGAGGATGSVTVTQNNAAAGAFLQTGAINTVGGSNGAGGAITLSSQSSLQFGAAATIQASGGTALAGTSGRNSGNVSLSGRTVTTTGAITASGSNGNGADQAGGNAGSISITSNGALTTSAGALTASGVNAGGGNAAGGNGGTITVTNNSATTGNVTTGAITARTGNAVGTGAGGTASSVTVIQNNATVGAVLQTGAINTSGGTKGPGGAVVLNSATTVNVTSTITTTGGAAVAGGTHAGAAGGNVTITGVDRTVTGLITASGGAAVGTDQAGGNAGIVSSTGTGTSTTGGVTARTGAATGTGAGGAAGSVTLTGTTVSSGAVNTSGQANGAGGNVTVASTTGTATLTTITTSGGTANANTAGRNAGAISLTGAGTVTTTTLTANGSAGNGANQAGGNGGTFTATSTGDNVSVSAVSTVGGNGLAGNANGGNGGMVSLDAGGATPTITHQNITTTGGNRFGTGTAGSGGTISIAADALLSANTTLTATGGSAGLGTGGNVTFGGTVNGNAVGRTLTINTNGTTTFSGAVGGTQALGSLTTNATGTVQIGGNVTTTGAQTYGDPVTLLGNAILTGTTPTFGSTVVGGGFNLALNFSGTTTINGANFTGINNFTTGNGGTTNLTGAFSTTGTQIYNDAVALTGAITVTSSGNQAITFNNTVNGAQALAVNTTGTTTFGGAVGGTTALTSLTTNAGGTTAINGGTITTTGAQTYNDAVTLGADTTLNAGAGAITFGNTLDGTFNLAANSTGTTTFSDAVGNTTPLTSLTTNAGGTTAINGGSVTTSGNQIYNDNVTMNQATTLTSTGGAITFGGNATNNAAGAGITVDAPTINLTSGTMIATTGNGAISFFTDTLNPNGASINAGTGTFALAPNVLTRTIEFGDMNTGRVTDVYYGSNFGSVTAGSITIGRPTHTGNIYVTGVAAALSAMTFVNGGVGSVTFENAPYVSGNQNLGVVSGSGGIAVDSSLVIGTGTLRLTTSGAIMQTAGAITVNIAGLSAGTGITLAQPTNNVTTLAAQTTGGNISFTDTDGFSIGSVSATVDGFHPAITDFTANAGTITLQSGGLVTQTQRILASALSLQGSGLYQLTNGANDVTSLAANTTGNVQYNDATALVLGASSITGGMDVTTGGAITQSGAVTVTGTTTLAAGAANDITLTNAGNNFSTVGIASGNNVTLNDTNTLILGASTVGGNLNVTTGGALTQSGAVTVAAITTLAAGGNDITLNNAANDFSTIGITSGNNVSLTDANALTINASTASGNITVSANDLTIGGPVASTGGNLNVTGANTVTQLANLTVNGARSATVTATTGSITMAPATTTTSGIGGAISYTAGTDVTLGSLSTGGGVTVIANNGSVLSAAGSGTNVTAGANSTLQAFNGVVGTQVAPMKVNVNPGTLSIRATTTVAGISAFLTGTVLPSNALTLLNVPPGLVCFNICPVASSPVPGLATGLTGLARSTFGYLNPETIIPSYYPQPSRSVLISDITSVYMPGTLLQPSPVSLSSGSPAVQSMGPKAKARARCEQGSAASFDAHCTLR